MRVTRLDTKIRGLTLPLPQKMVVYKGVLPKKLVATKKVGSYQIFW